MQHIGAYCRSKHDRSLVKYPHPDLAEILDETYGVITYQDQVLFVLQKFAGYSLKDADAIRKAMSKKIASLMQAEGEKFIAAAVKNGYSDQEARAVFDLSAVRVRFNKAHSACYGISPADGVLKVTTPYMTAVSTRRTAHRRGGAECVRLGSRVPPDVNRSGAT
jgi:DNA polymerase-3 subunit alpha